MMEFAIGLEIEVAVHTQRLHGAQTSLCLCTPPGYDQKGFRIARAQQALEGPGKRGRECLE